MDNTLNNTGEKEMEKSEMLSIVKKQGQMVILSDGTSLSWKMTYRGLSMEKYYIWETSGKPLPPEDKFNYRSIHYSFESHWGGYIKPYSNGIELAVYTD